MAGKKSIFDLYNEQNPKTETTPDEKIVMRDPETEKEKVVPKTEPVPEPKTDAEQPKTEPVPEPKTDAEQAKESEGGENV